MEVVLPGEVAMVVNEAERGVERLQGLQLEGMEMVALMLMRGESAASSRIEGLVMSQRRLAEALFDPESAGEVARAVVGNLEAIDKAVRGSAKEGVSVKGILEMHEALLQNTGNARIAGKLRVEQGWIGGSPYSPAKANYIGPPEGEVERLLEDLCAFCLRDDLPALVQAAIAQAQFELIHPFGDGNGRVGRSLIHAILKKRGLANRFVPPVSMVLAASPNAYIAGLDVYQQGDVSRWCGQFAEAMGEAATLGIRLVGAFEQLEAKWMEQAGRPRAGSAMRAVIGMLPGRPVVDVNSVEKALGVSDEAARMALNGLEEAGVLSLTKVSRWRRAWAAKEVFEVMNRYEKTLWESGEGVLKARAPQVETKEGEELAGAEEGLGLG